MEQSGLCTPTLTTRGPSHTPKASGPFSAPHSHYTGLLANLDFQSLVTIFCLFLLLQNKSPIQYENNFSLSSKIISNITSLTYVKINIIHFQRLDHFKIFAFDKSSITKPTHTQKYLFIFPIRYEKKSVQTSASTANWYAIFNSPSWRASSKQCSGSVDTVSACCLKPCNKQKQLCMETCSARTWWLHMHN